MKEKLYTLDDLVKAYVFGYIDRDAKLNIFNDETPSNYLENRMITEEDCWDGDETDKIQY